MSEEDANPKLTIVLTYQDQDKELEDLKTKNPTLALNIQKYEAVCAIHNPLKSKTNTPGAWQQVREATTAAQKHKAVLSKEVDSAGIRFLRALAKFLPIFSMYFSIFQPKEDKKGCSFIEKMTDSIHPKP